MWLDEALFESSARSDKEPRFIVVGVIAGKHWSAFITYRGESVRLISVRRSRFKEVVLYEGK